MGIPESKSTLEANYTDYNKVNQKKQQNQPPSVEADCCDNQKNDYIILIDCGHLYHLHCWQQKQREQKQFICFCESQMKAKLPFQVKPCY
ncbi:unnamed protein product (macronuclear) [Paramecium tetraurelia]|uniref:RING-type domain-containing protein n=1 Tax=Paramecium tetraurelia TaxID=5888 RepID=A0BUU0_PARTE|nr:uncharacterized protein GSPATT00005553001 [Paramecium tetraurelia]CAK62307.1 unnamed protein product [Paramecium tetraurelia]|eukprot:XP_001429705.1 hypothetical protein (macronuclear) [Paramecium tetraurelia strain d4-2]